MGNPFDVFDNQPAQQGPMTVGIRRPPEPKIPTPQNPEQRQSTIVSTERAQQGMTYDRAGAIDKARDGYRQDKRVLTYEAALPIYISGLQSPENAAGDNLLVNALAKVSDPLTGVQQREGASWESAQPQLDQIKASFLKQFGSDGYGNFTPEGRQKMRQVLQVRMRALADQYRAARAEQVNYIKSLNLPNVDPGTIIGPFAGDAFAGAEQAYIGHKPTLNYKQTSDGSLIDATTGAPIDPQTGQRTPDGAPPPPTTTERGFDIAPSGTTPTASGEDFRNSLFAAMKSGQIKSPADIHAFEQQYNTSHQTGWHVDANNPDTLRAIKAAQAGKGFNVETPRPNISDVRGGQNTDGQDMFNAGVRGLPDSLSAGAIDKVIAAGDTLFKGGPMDYNLARQYAISDYDQEHHPWARLTGQALGAAMLPMGEMKGVSQIALKSAGVGGAYGVGSSRSLGDVPQNALLGAAGGGIVGGGLASIGKGINALAVGTGRKLAGETTPEQRAILDAGARENVPVNMGDLYPGLRNTIATQESIPGSSGPVRRGIQAGRDAIEQRVTDLGQGGVARGEGALGERIYKGGQRIIDDHRAASKRDYGIAKNLAGPDFKATPQEAAAATQKVIGSLSETPNSNKSALSFYKDVFKDFIDDQGNLKPLSIDAIKEMRRNLRLEMSSRGLTGSTADSRLQSIIDAASSDMYNALAAKDPRAAAAYRKADEGYAKRMSFIQDTLQQFIGTKDKPVSGEALTAKIRSMSGSGARGNARKLNEFMGALLPEERADTAATFAAGLGRKSAEEPFSPGTFLSNIRNIDERSRIILFGKSGARSIQNLIKLSTAKQESVNRLNNSRSGMVVNYRTVLSNLVMGVPGGSAVAGAAVGIGGATSAVTGLAASGGLLVGSRSLAKAFMNEEFTRAIAQAPASTSAKAINAHFGRLKQIAAKDPSVRAVVESLEQKLLSHANDNASRMGSAAASPDEGPNKQKQPQR